MERKMSEPNAGADLERPILVDSLPWEEWSEGVRFGGRARRLSNTRAGRGLRIGVLIEELAPGKQSCPLHYHLLEEEHVLMLEGEVTLRLGEERIRFRAGEFVSFKAGDPIGHCLVNEGDAPARYLVIGENNPNEVCLYPESGKIAIDKLGELRQLGPIARYYDGEKADEPFTRG